jgi:type IV secretion system protein VirB10
MRIALFLLAAGVIHAANEIPKGAHVALRLVNSINTRTAREGDYIYMRTASPIAANGQIVVPADSYVQGVVTRSKRPGRVSGRGELGIRIETLTLPNGKVIRVSPHLASTDSGTYAQRVDAKENGIRQGSSHGKDAETIAGTSAAGAAIGGIAASDWNGAGIGAGIGGGVGVARVLLTRGREVELPQGYALDVVFERAVPLE